MISLSPIKDRKYIGELFSRYNLCFNDESGCVQAICTGDVMGFCLYYLSRDKMTVLYLSPTDDLPLADGILRSTLHVAAERSITNIFYTAEFEEIYNKLGFISSKTEKRLNIDRLFGGCQCCNK